MKFTDHEKECAIEEMAERMKDVVFMNARDQAEKAFDQIPAHHWDRTENTVTVEYKFSFVINDMIQIIGHKRRKRKCRITGSG